MFRMGISRKGLAQRWGNRIYQYLDQNKEIPLVRRDQRPYLRVIPSPRLLTFGIRLQKPSDLDRVLRLGDELALYLEVANCRLSRYFGEILVEMPLPKPMWEWLSASDLPLNGGTNVTLGNTTLMSPVRCRLSSQSIAPVLIAGRTGAGKTEAMRLILWQLAKQNAPTGLDNCIKFVIFDPKGKFDAISRLPHLALPIAHTKREGIHAVGWLLQELNVRLENKIAKPRIIFAIDELITLMEDDELVGESLGRISALGRERGIHPVMAIQRPDRTYMNRLSAANIGLRLVGQVADTVESRVACGMGGMGAHLLSGSGDFLATVGGTAHRLQIGLVDEQTFCNLPAMEAPPDKAEESYDLNVLLGLKSLEERETELAPFSPEEIATALTGLGIVKLKQCLYMGQSRATRLRDMWARPILDKLHELGYDLVKRDETTKGN